VTKKKPTEDTAEDVAEAEPVEEPTQSEPEAAAPEEAAQSQREPRLARRNWFREPRS
jgi:hypothetical protein